MASRQIGPGKRKKTPQGYIQVYYPQHPDSGKAGFVLEHRLVAEVKYGRRLLKWEHVHHINGVKDDNRPENLIVMESKAHLKLTNKETNTMRAEIMQYRQRYGPLPTDATTHQLS